MYTLKGEDHFITRLGGGWTMYVRFDGVVHYNRFLDRDHVDEVGSKQAAREFRDKLLNKIGYRPKIRNKKQGYDDSLLTGVIEVSDQVRNSNRMYRYNAIVATHPTIRGRRKRFNYVESPTRSNQRDRGEAIYQANKQRLEWESELGLISVGVTDTFS